MEHHINSLHCGNYEKINLLSQIICWTQTFLKVIDDGMAKIVFLHSVKINDEL